MNGKHIIFSRQGLFWCILLVMLCVALLTSASCVVGGDCVYDIDCQPNELCTDRKCHKFALDGGTARTCRFDSDCPAQQVCNSGRCRSAASLFETVQKESPTPLPDRVAWEPPTVDSIQPPEQDAESTPEQSTPDHTSPPPLGKPPAQHAVASGAMFSSTAQYRHMAVVGQLTPLVPKATVMRSGNYSMRVGIVAVTMW